MYLYGSIYNVLNFSVFDHTSSGKHDVPWYGVKETDSIDVHEVTAYVDLFVLIKDGFGDTFYLDGLHMITNVPKTILDKYKEVTICCDLTHINGIGFLITISWHIMFATGSMIKNRKFEHIADGITQVHKL